MEKRRNHPSALLAENATALDVNTQKEIDQGWVVPIPTSIIQKTPDLNLTPLGVAIQKTIGEDGSRKLKRRIIHDCSFPSASGTSVNLQHDKDLLEECIYGQCLRCLLHQLHRLRIEHPTLPIYISKYDLDAAYRCLHVFAKHAVKAAIIINHIAYIQTRLPFGTTAGPSVYSSVSEAIMDLVNDVLQEPDWSPREIQFPHSTKLLEPDTSKKDQAFATAKPLAVKPPLLLAFCDGYIDDLVTTAVHLSNHVQRT